MPVQRAFGDPDLTPDNFSSFSKQEIAADTAAKGLERLGPIPKARNTTPIELSDIVGADKVNAILKKGQMVFHCVGDTGGIHEPQFQFAVADAMADDLKSGAAFFYHLGDVIYYFGQEQYYFEQFYDPYRNYNAPIFAIPGNHDGAIFTGQTEDSLSAFIENFCATQPGVDPAAQGASRTTMDQPGVYFTLNAPFVKFIGLYSNTSEGGTEGVISSPKLGDHQLVFLQQQLAAAKSERDSGKTFSLVIATHHPPFTGSPFHVPSPSMLRMIDKACGDAGIYPDLHLSGHTHAYEHYTRTIGGKEVPYIVAGMGGYYNLPGLKPVNKRPTPPKPDSGTDADGNPLRLDYYNQNTFGYLRLTASAEGISGTFVTVNTDTGKTGVGDTFTATLGLSGGGGADTKTKKPSKATKATKTSKATKVTKATKPGKPKK